MIENCVTMDYAKTLLSKHDHVLNDLQSKYLKLMEGTCNIAVLDPKQVKLHSRLVKLAQEGLSPCDSGFEEKLLKSFSKSEYQYYHSNIVTCAAELSESLKPFFETFISVLKYESELVSVLKSFAQGAKCLQIDSFSRPLFVYSRMLETIQLCPSSLRRLGGPVGVP